MTSRISLLSAALAIASFTASPTLAQNAPAASTESGVHADVSKTGVDAGTKTTVSTDKKAKDKATQQKPREQVAQHPGETPKAKTDSSTGK